MTTKIKDAENKYNFNYISCYIYSLAWTLPLHTLESPGKTASSDDKATISPSKLVLESIILPSPNTARFEPLFSTKASKFEQVCCLVPSVLSSLSGTLLSQTLGLSCEGSHPSANSPGCQSSMHLKIKSGISVGK